MNILKDTHEGIRTTKPPPFVFIAEEELAVTIAPVLASALSISPSVPAPFTAGSAVESS